jgi:hypothetical protein
MRIVVPVVVEMTDQQMADYADWAGLAEKPRAKDVVESVRRFVVNSAQTGFDHVGSGADAFLKER